MFDLLPHGAVPILFHEKKNISKFPALITKKVKMKRKKKDLEISEQPRKKVKFDIDKAVSDSKKISSTINFFKKFRKDLEIAITRNKNSKDFLNLVIKKHAKNIKNNGLIDNIKELESTYDEYFVKVKDKVDLLLDNEKKFLTKFEEIEEEIKKNSNGLNKCGICLYPLTNKKDCPTRRCPCEIDNDNKKNICWKCVDKLRSTTKGGLEKVVCPFCKKKMFVDETKDEEEEESKIETIKEVYTVWYSM